MDEREQKIVDAAIAVISRYGVKRTTMNDIAGEAGVVRQTLYNVYANKDEVLRAAIRLHADRSLATIEAACARTPDLGDQLDVVFTHLAVKPYDMVHATPHADEIIEGFNAAAKEELVVAEDRYRSAMETLLVPYTEALGKAGLGVPEFADFIVTAFTGFKKRAKSKKHLVGLLATLKTMVLGVTAAG